MPYIGVPPADRTSGARVRDEFTGDGTQVCFQLSQEVPGSFESNIIAVVENVIQEPVEAYTIIDTVTISLTSISGTFTKNETVTGGTSSAAGTVIQVNLNNIVVRVTSGTFQSAETVTGGTSSASATISALETNVGRGLLFSSTPTSSAAIYVLHQNAATYQLKPAAGSVTPETLSENLRTFTVDKFTATSSQTAFSLSTTPVSVKSILVFVDGVMQTETTHYTLSGATLTMGSGLASGQQVTVVHLGFSTVSRTAFPDGSVTTAMIADGAITSDKIATGGVATIDMADGSVTSLKIANGGIAAEDLASDSVTTAKILNANVTADKLASDSVTTAKILDANVTSGKLASGAAVANIGYTPVNKAGDTMTGRLSIHNSTETGYASNISESVSKSTIGLRGHSTDSPQVVVGSLATGVNGAVAGSAYIQRTNGTSSWDLHLQPFGGYVLMPNQPAFHVNKTDGHVSGDGSFRLVTFNAVSLNQGEHYSTSTGRFTAPVSGKYFFIANGMSSYNQSGDLQLAMYLNGNQYNVSNPASTGTDGARPFTTMAVISMSANDYVDVRFYSNNTSSYLYGTGGKWNGFCGYLIG